MPNDLLKTIKNGLVPIHPEGPKFAIAAFVIGLILTLMWDPFFWIGLILAIYCLYFFRNPARVTPVGDKLVIAPADGLIQRIVEVVPPAELNLGSTTHARISTFLNIFDVHVNRNPVTGSIGTAHYIKGKFVNAELDKASEDNERQLLTYVTPTGTKVGLIQIAGLIARRIVCNIGQGEPVVAGREFGLIRFGSRVDVYLPLGTRIKVLEGQRSIAGETVLAELS